MKVFKTSFRASHNALAALTLFLGLPLASIDKDVSDFKSGLDNKSMQKNFAGDLSWHPVSMLNC